MFEHIKTESEVKLVNKIAISEEEEYKIKIWYYNNKIVCLAKFGMNNDFISYYTSIAFDTSISFFIKECIKSKKEIDYIYDSNIESIRSIPLSIHDTILTVSSNNKIEEMLLDQVLIRSEFEDQYNLLIKNLLHLNSI